MVKMARGGWNKDVVGGKKSKNLTIGRGGTIIRDPRVSLIPGIISNTAVNIQILSISFSFYIISN